MQVKFLQSAKISCEIIWLRKVLLAGLNNIGCDLLSVKDMSHFVRQFSTIHCYFERVHTLYCENEPNRPTTVHPRRHHSLCQYSRIRICVATALSLTNNNTFRHSQF